MWGRSAAVAAAVAALASAVAAPGRAAAAGVPAAGDAGATDSAVPVAASFIVEGPDLFPVVCVMFSWPGHPQDRVGCVAHPGYVAQVLRTGHVDLCTPNQPMCRVEFTERPTTARYGPGKVVDVGPYRCEVLKVAVRCLVRSTGSGFRINNHEAVRVAAGPPKKSAAPKPVFSRSCGTTHLLQGGGARVTIVHGSLSCAEARGVVRLYGSSRGTGHYLNHGRGLSYATYPGGWVCGALERGYSRCFRGGLGSLSKGLTLTSVRNARAVVELFVVF